MPLLFQKIVGSLVRAALTGLGTYLISAGWVTEGDWTQAAMAITPVVVSVGWGVYQKYGAVLMAEALRALPSGATRDAAREDLAKIPLSEKLSTACAARD